MIGCQVERADLSIKTTKYEKIHFKKFREMMLTKRTEFNDQWQKFKSVPHALKKEKPLLQKD